MLVPFKDDNPKITENTGFQAGSDSTPMAMHKSIRPSDSSTKLRMTTGVVNYAILFENSLTDKGNAIISFSLSHLALYDLMKFDWTTVSNLLVSINAHSLSTSWLPTRD